MPRPLGTAGHACSIAGKSEKRAALVGRHAYLLIEGHEQSISCVVHDISDGGARLSFTAPQAVLPRTFTLVLLKDSVQRNCELVWSDRRFIGVKFISEWFGIKSSSACRPVKNSHAG